jgi:hypothetical protein
LIEEAIATLFHWLVQRRYLSAESMTLIPAALRSEERSLESQQQHKEVAATLNAA